MTSEQKKPSFSLAHLESEILERWQREKTFEQSVEKNPIENTYRFFDGPPFATGLPHYGHLLASTMKDAMPRYQTMRGKRVERKWGWDCHGLPVENLIETELGYTSKQDIEDDIAKFNSACRDSVMRYADEWKKIIPRMGRWIDMEDDYRTMNFDYMESVWWVFGQLWDQDLIFEGHKPMHICPRCVTPLSNFEVNQPGAYQDVTDLSVTAKFKVKGEEDTYILAWTTTPWTLPSNIALAVHPEVEYVKVKINKYKYPDGHISYKSDVKAQEVVPGKDLVPTTSSYEGYDVLICAKKLLAKVFISIDPNFGYDEKTDTLFNNLIESKIIETFKGQKLLDDKTEYEPLFDWFADSEGGYRVVGADFVTTEDGTGIVHIAPAFGEEDYAVGRKEKLPWVQHITMDGAFTAECGDWAGRSIAGRESLDATNLEVMKYLGDKVFSKQKIKHSYPHCWRCDTPLLNFATSSWFVDVPSIRDQLIENNKKVNWTPSHLRDGRFGKMLETAPDWNIARNRYWGAPIPIWECENENCEEKKCISNVSELESHLPKKNDWYALRHGEGDHNVNPIFAGDLDNDTHHLTEAGRKKVAESASEIKKLGITKIYCSPFVRTRETAEIVAKELGLEIVIDDRLREMCNGDYEGKLQVDELHEAHENWKRDADYHYPGGGESQNDAAKRIGEFYTEMDAKHEGEKILIISHKGVIVGGLIHLYQQDWERSVDRFGTIEPGTWIKLSPIITDLHRPMIDEVGIPCAKCGGQMKRIEEVFDCWFESGSMPFAQFGERENAQIPADFIAEGIDQTRGWFYSTIVLSTAIQNSPFAKNIIVNGTILAADGKKMSKRLKNYPDPMELVEKYGADALRFNLLSSAVVHAEDMNFSESGVSNTMRQVLMPLWNTFSFYDTYATAERKTSSENKLDTWIISHLNSLILDVTQGMEAYDFQAATRPFIDFLDDLTNWYVRRSRSRFREGDEQAIATLQTVLTTMSQLIAPFCPFISEAIWGKLGQERSVHLSDWPSADPKLIDKDLEAEITLSRAVVRLGHAVRARTKLRVRQPLALAKLAVSQSISPAELQVIAEELNVKNIELVADPAEIAKVNIAPQARVLGPKFGKEVQTIIKAAREGRFELTETGALVDGKYELNQDEFETRYESREGFEAESDMGVVIALDTSITEELELEGIAREIIRAIQDLRKESGLHPSDQISIFVESDNDKIKNSLERFSEYIQSSTGSVELSHSAEDHEHQQDIEIEGLALTYGLKKI